MPRNLLKPFSKPGDQSLLPSAQKAEASKVVAATKPNNESGFNAR